MVGSENAFCAIQYIMAVQGHPRSLILTPIESAYATSYYSLIETLALYCTVSKTRRLSGHSHKNASPLQLPRLSSLVTMAVLRSTRYESSNNLLADLISIGGQRATAVPQYTLLLCVSDNYDEKKTCACTADN